MIVVSTVLLLLLILLIIFAIRHWLISLLKALKHFNLMKDYLEFTFFKFPNMVFKLKLFFSVLTNRVFILSLGHLSDSFSFIFVLSF